MLAARLADRPGLDVTLSLAGRTAMPVAQPVPIRIGGFGGISGLVAFLRSARIDALVDATHPYAAQISAHAATAAVQADVPWLALRRPAWRAVAGDRWIEVGDVAEAVQALGTMPRRVFAALGRNDIAPLSDAPQHYYLVRSVDPIDRPLPLPHAAFVVARGPFDEADEAALLRAHDIDVILAKNSGGAATYGKIAAARALGIEVIMLRRPVLPEAPSVTTVDEAMAWLDHALASTAARGV